MEINAILLAIGAISIIMIITGGIRYSRQTGAGVKRSTKDIVLYTASGIAAAILAYLVVTFVIDLLSGFN